MPIFKSQVIYNFAGETKPKLVGEGDDQIRVPDHGDFQTALGNAEEAVGQIITQDNAESERLNNLINDQGFTELSGAATLADVIAVVNQIQTVLTNLVIKGKDRE